MAIALCIPTNNLGTRLAWQKMQYMGGPRLREQYNHVDCLKTVDTQKLLLNLNQLRMGKEGSRYILKWLSGLLSYSLPLRS